MRTIDDVLSLQKQNQERKSKLFKHYHGLNARLATNPNDKKLHKALLFILSEIHSLKIIDRELDSIIDKLSSKNVA